MKKLDLHGKYHNDVYDLVQDWTITQFNKGYRDLQIITGNSEQMKSIASEALEEAGFKYRIGDFFGDNRGYIQIL
jgi:hypothetical protein